VIADDLGEPLQDLCQFVGKATNNEAEYRALIEGLKAVSKWKPDRLEIYLDSKLVVEQIKGKYKIKEPRLQVLHGEAKQLFDEFPNASIEYVERERNKRADALANKAIDDKVKKSTTPGLT
jgi:probable phosphoglycerate mutase